MSLATRVGIVAGVGVLILIALAALASVVPIHEKCARVPYETGARPSCVEVRNR